MIAKGSIQYENCLYRPLPVNHIRLLRPSPNTSTPELGSLEVTDLHNAPPYHALSHSWSFQHSQAEETINGHKLALGINLVACIRRLSALYETNTGPDPNVKYVWIDSICINQDDVAERSSQVGLMRQIYRNSTRTLIWLGQDLTNSVAGWRLLDQVHDAFRQQYPKAVVVSDIPVRTFSQTVHDSLGLPAWNDDAWEHLRRNMELRWFSRIWVVQEVALSRRDPVILHGSNFYPWDHISWSVAWLRRNGYLRLPQIPEQLRNVDTMANIRRAHTPWPLDALMSITQVKFHATDQRDKVYGLLGLAAECQNDTNVPDELKPDYSIAVTDLYQRIAHLLLKKGSSLAILTRAHGVEGTGRQRREYDLDLPSWCPDWSDFKVFNEGLSTSLSWIHYEDIYQPARLGFPSHYAASSGLQSQLEQQLDTSSLQVHGIRLAHVDRVFAFDVGPLGEIASGQNFALQIEMILGEVLSTLQETNWSSWMEKFIRTTTAEQHRLVGRDWDQLLQDGLAYLHELLTDDASTVLSSTFQTNRNQLISVLQGPGAKGTTGQYELLALRYCFDRAFLITIDGRMGIGPSSIHQGDVVAVLVGGGVPYCIRREGDHWLFVGESYVEGLMDGMASEAFQQGDVAEEIFHFE